MAVSYSDSDRGKQKEALKIKRLLQKEMDVLKLDNMTGSEGEEIDFSKELHPLGYFINDREQMVEEMFSIIKEEKLKKMLPPLLKSYTAAELKADCLVHLLGMSRKRILAILEGRDLNSSSDSESEPSHSDSDSTEKPQVTTNTHARSNSEEGDTLDISISKDDLEILAPDKSNHSLKKRKLKVKEAKCNKSSKPVTEPAPISSIVISDDEVDTSKRKKRKDERTELKFKKKMNEIRREEKANQKKIRKLKKGKSKPSVQSTDESNSKETNTEQNSDEESDSKKGKSLLEILELEMRARAIRALLKNTPNIDEPVPVSILNMKPEPLVKLEKNCDINKTIAEVIDDKSKGGESSDTCDVSDDVEISEVCDVDLTVTIDDDDDDILQPEMSSVKSTGVSSNTVDSTVVKETSKTIDCTKVNATSKSVDSFPSTKATCHTVDGSDSKKSEEDPASTDSTDTSAVKGDVSWSQRWIESKGVKEVMKNTKLCANIRKRMRFVRMLKQKELKENNAKLGISVDLDSVEESSVAQYNLIKSLDKLKEVAEKSNENSQAPTHVPQTDQRSAGEIVDTVEKTSDRNSADSSGEILLVLDSSDVLEVCDLTES